MDRFVIVLAAGNCTNMKSRDPQHSKVSYPILGRPMIYYVLDTVEKVNPAEIVTVVGFGGEETSKIVSSRSKVVWQKEILGTANAVNCAKDLLLSKKGETLVIYGDTPLIPEDVIHNIFTRHEKSGNDLTVVSAILSQPSGYGRIIREHKSNKVLSIKEEKDCDEYELDINEVNTGICVIDNELLWKYIDKIDNNNNRKLFYLSQLVDLFNKDGLKVDDYVVEQQVDAFGINNRVQLAYAEKVMRKRVNVKYMLSGVSIENPDATYISPDCIIGRDTVILPNTTIKGKCVIGEGNIIGPNSYLEDVVVGNDCVLQQAWLKNTTINDGSKNIPSNSEVK